MFGDLKKAKQMGEFFSKLKNEGKIDLRELKKADDLDIDFSFIPQVLNEDLDRQERILKAAGGDVDTKRFELSTVEEIFARYPWNEAIKKIGELYDEQQRKIQRELCRELGLENEVDELVPDGGE